MRKLLLYSFTLLSACSSQQNDSSEIQQLVEKSYTCSPNNETLEKFAGHFGGYILTNSQKDRSEVYGVMSLIPLEYLRWAFFRNDMKVSVRSEDGNSVRGLTTLIAARNILLRPISMWVKPKRDNFHPFLHEMGHAAQPYIIHTFSGVTENLKNLYNKVNSTSEGRYMRFYAKGHQDELFAEIFDSFYCSADSRSMMEKHMPLSFAFARNYFVPAEDVVTSTSQDALAAEGKQIDDDQDGVSNYYDKCKDTIKGEPVYGTDKLYGCSERQVYPERFKDGKSMPGPKDEVIDAEVL